MDLRSGGSSAVSRRDCSGQSADLGPRWDVGKFFLTVTIFQAKPVSVMANSDSSEGVAPEQPEDVASEKGAASPHDTFVYRILSNPVSAAAELRAVLPPRIAQEIAWENLELENNRFVTGNLDNRYSDLSFKTTIRQHDVRIQLLIEHSSHAKPLELLQTLQYQMRSWEREVQQKKDVGASQRLTPILTIILHHSETGWRGRKRFIDYFGLDPELARILRPYVVDFGIVLDDISKVNTKALVRRQVPPDVQILLFALRYGRSGAKVLEELPKLGSVLTKLWPDPNGRLVLALFFLYIKRVAKVAEAELRSVLQQFIGPQLDPEMVALWTQFEAGEQKGRIEGELKGKLEGELKGKLEGELKGNRSVLLRQLTQRFGLLSPAQLARLEATSLEELEVMTLRILTAGSIDEVFGTP
jgi:predicted transposase YdaD